MEVNSKKMFSDGSMEGQLSIGEALIDAQPAHRDVQALDCEGTSTIGVAF
jgi:hypothetical protein